MNVSPPTLSHSSLLLFLPSFFFFVLLALYTHNKKFETLYSQLKKKYEPIGLFIPPLPDSRPGVNSSSFKLSTGGHQTDAFLRKRMQGLTMFVNMLHQSVFLRYDPDYMKFLSTSSKSDVVRGSINNKTSFSNSGGGGGGGGGGRGGREEEEEEEDISFDDVDDEKFVNGKGGDQRWHEFMVILQSINNFNGEGVKWAIRSI
jgi:uncharacterized membrane protein YgcG